MIRCTATSFPKNRLGDPRRRIPAGIKSCMGERWNLLQTYTSPSEKDLGFTP
eukprot:CAMPEP_0194206402 /NCGR_PEP_ID=MMETSP0156-20130528/5454_1 /TAXON_ID=33649 /ORGANISM="Thalassionema nitzschioides, Strain L26-B" /LENGTH=51 /DNA_ID=CAMNT_0038932925 /DNA_START=134 /DNA_END=285 /DNA_ORIENTATION=+